MKINKLGRVTVTKKMGLSNDVSHSTPRLKDVWRYKMFKREQSNINTDRIARYTMKRGEISDGLFYSIAGVMAVLLAINMTLSYEFGAAHGGDDKQRLLFGISLATFDVIAAILGFIFIRRGAKALAWYVLIGVISGSIYAAFAMMAAGLWGQSNFSLESKKKTIEILQATYARTEKIAVRQQLAQAESDYQRLEARAGGGSGITYGYHLIANWGGWDPKAVELVLRLYWASVLVLAGVAFGAILGDYYCPTTLRWYANAVVGNEKAKIEGKAKLNAIEMQERKGIEEKPKVNLPKPEPVIAHFKAPIITRDNWDVDEKTTYEKVRAGVVKGSVKPTVRAIQKAGKVGQGTAVEWQKKMVKEAVIKKAGKGFVRNVV